MKKGFLICGSSMAIIALTVCAFNILTDPFGVFGDAVTDWYAYNMTSNPRVAKIAYLDKRHELYDSYIIGGSKTGSFSTHTLNKYYNGARFYNMLMDGADMYDIQVVSEYILENYNPQNIIINIGLEESAQFNTKKPDISTFIHAKAERKPLLPFYTNYLLANPIYGFNKLQSYLGGRSFLPRLDAMIIPETGRYNDTVRDTRPISALGEYLAQPENAQFSEPFSEYREMPDMDNVLDAVRQIKELCEKKGCSFRLIASPVFYKEVNTYDAEQLKLYWHSLAQVTDFWDFSGYSPISFDPRYFYDAYHFRNAVGDIALAFMFGEGGIYMPEGFGHHTTRFNVKQHAERIFTKPELIADASESSERLPILMYHHIDSDESVSSAETVTPQKFRADMQALLDNGYTAITYREAADYAMRGTPLPEKPVIITFDDGYYSNYEYAYPILKELRMKAVISIIGISVGKNVYKDTDYPIIEHFGYAEAKEMYDSGVIDIQSHGFSMHDSAKYESAQSLRQGVLQGADESDNAYIKRFTDDFIKLKADAEHSIGNSIYVYTYPFGLSNTLCEALLPELGVYVTVTINRGVSELVKGLPQSLFGLKRINAGSDLGGDALIAELERDS